MAAVGIFLLLPSSAFPTVRAGTIDGATGLWAAVVVGLWGRYADRGIMPAVTLGFFHTVAKRQRLLWVGT